MVALSHGFHNRRDKMRIMLVVQSRKLPRAQNRSNNKLPHSQSVEARL